MDMMKSFALGLVAGAIMTGMTLWTDLTLAFGLPTICCLAIIISLFPFMMILYLFWQNEFLGTLLRVMMGFFIGSILVMAIGFGMGYV